MDKWQRARAHVAIREEKLAAAVHAALCKLSFTTAAVSVRQNSTAVRHFVFELALVAGAAGVQQCAFALPAPVYKFPLVLNTNREEQSAVALPVSVAVFTVIAIAVFGHVLAFACHLALQPAAAVVAAAVVVVRAFPAEVARLEVSYVN